MQHWYDEFKKTMLLAFPIVLSQVSQHLIQVIDSAMIGRVGVVQLAAAAFAGSVFTIPLVFCFGLTGATSILTANAFGAGDRKRANHVLRVGLILTSSLGLFLAVVMTFGSGIMSFFGQSEEVLAEAKPYFHILMWSIVPTMIFACGKNYSEAMNRPWMPLKIVLLMLVTNVVFNWIFIFGKFGFPAMGLTGAGWGTLIARIVSAVAMMLVIGLGKQWNFRFRTRDWLRIKKDEIFEFLSIGIPSGLQIIFEVTAFVVAAIMMGWLGEVVLASHQIAINVAAMTFMATLGVAFASSVRVGQAYGRKDFVSLRRTGIVGWSINTGFMCFCMLMLFLLRNVIPTWFVKESEVIGLAARLLVIAGLFQIFDGIQVSMISVLRGMRDVKVPTILVMVVYNVICLPLAYTLGFVFDLRGEGIWTGLAVGLALSAVALSIRFHVKTKRLIASGV